MAQSVASPAGIGVTSLSSNGCGDLTDAPHSRLRCLLYNAGFLVAVDKRPTPEPQPGWNVALLAFAAPITTADNRAQPVSRAAEAPARAEWSTDDEDFA